MRDTPGKRRAEEGPRSGSRQVAMNLQGVVGGVSKRPRAVCSTRVLRVSDPPFRSSAECGISVI